MDTILPADSKHSVMTPSDLNILPTQLCIDKRSGNWFIFAGLKNTVVSGQGEVKYAAASLLEENGINPNKQFMVAAQKDYAALMPLNEKIAHQTMTKAYAALAKGFTNKYAHHMTRQRAARALPDIKKMNPVTLAEQIMDLASFVRSQGHETAFKNVVEALDKAIYTFAHYVHRVYGTPNDQTYVAIRRAVSLKDAKEKYVPPVFKYKEADIILHTDIDAKTAAAPAPAQDTYAAPAAAQQPATPEKVLPIPASQRLAAEARAQTAAPDAAPTQDLITQIADGTLNSDLISKLFSARQILNARELIAYASSYLKPQVLQLLMTEYHVDPTSIDTLKESALEKLRDDSSGKPAQAVPASQRPTPQTPGAVRVQPRPATSVPVSRPAPQLPVSRSAARSAARTALSDKDYATYTNGAVKLRVYTGKTIMKHPGAVMMPDGKAIPLESHATMILQYLLTYPNEDVTAAIAVKIVGNHSAFTGFNELKKIFADVPGDKTRIFVTDKTICSKRDAVSVTAAPPVAPKPVAAAPIPEPNVAPAKIDKETYTNDLITLSVYKSKSASVFGTLKLPIGKSVTLSSGATGVLLYVLTHPDETVGHKDAQTIVGNHGGIVGITELKKIFDGIPEDQTHIAFTDKSIRYNKTRELQSVAVVEAVAVPETPVEAVEPEVVEPVVEKQPETTDISDAQKSALEYIRTNQDRVNLDDLAQILPDIKPLIQNLQAAELALEAKLADVLTKNGMAFRRHAKAPSYSLKAVKQPKAPQPRTEKVTPQEFEAGSYDIYSAHDATLWVKKDMPRMGISARFMIAGEEKPIELKQNEAILARYVMQRPDTLINRKEIPASTDISLASVSRGIEKLDDQLRERLGDKSPFSARRGVICFGTRPTNEPTAKRTSKVESAFEPGHYDDYDTGVFILRAAKEMPAKGISAFIIIPEREPIPLKRMDAQVARYMVQHRNELVTRAQIAETLPGKGSFATKKQNISHSITALKAHFSKAFGERTPFSVDFKYICLGTRPAIPETPRPEPRERVQRATAPSTPKTKSDFEPGNYDDHDAGVFTLRVKKDMPYRGASALILIPDRAPIPLNRFEALVARHFVQNPNAPFTRTEIANALPGNETSKFALVSISIRKVNDLLKEHLGEQSPLDLQHSYICFGTRPETDAKTRAEKTESSKAGFKPGNYEDIDAGVFILRIKNDMPYRGAAGLILIPDREPIELSRWESKAALYLVQNPNKPVTRTQIAEAIPGDAETKQFQLNVAIKKLTATLNRELGEKSPLSVNRKDVCFGIRSEETKAIPDTPASEGFDIGRYDDLTVASVTLRMKKDLRAKSDFVAALMMIPGHDPIELRGLEAKVAHYILQHPNKDLTRLEIAKAVGNVENDADLQAAFIRVSPGIRRLGILIDMHWGEDAPFQITRKDVYFGTTPAVATPKAAVQPKPNVVSVPAPAAAIAFESVSAPTDLFFYPRFGLVKDAGVQTKVVGSHSIEMRHCTMIGRMQTEQSFPASQATKIGYGPVDTKAYAQRLKQGLDDYRVASSEIWKLNDIEAVFDKDKSPDVVLKLLTYFVGKDLSSSAKIAKRDMVGFLKRQVTAVFPYVSGAWFETYLDFLPNYRSKIENDPILWPFANESTYKIAQDAVQKARRTTHAIKPQFMKLGQKGRIHDGKTLDVSSFLARYASQPALTLTRDPSVKPVFAQAVKAVEPIAVEDVVTAVTVEPLDIAVDTPAPQPVVQPVFAARTRPEKDTRRGAIPLSEEERKRLAQSDNVPQNHGDDDVERRVLRTARRPEPRPNPADNDRRFETQIVIKPAKEMPQLAETDYYYHPRLGVVKGAQDAKMYEITLTVLGNDVLPPNATIKLKIDAALNEGLHPIGKANYLKWFDQARQVLTKPFAGKAFDSAMAARTQALRSMHPMVLANVIRWTKENPDPLGLGSAAKDIATKRLALQIAAVENKSVADVTIEIGQLLNNKIKPAAPRMVP